MKWTIHYYNQSVKEGSRDLPKSIKAKFEAIMDKMIGCGPDIGLPFTKAMGKGLFEIRAKAQEGIARGMFCTISGNTIVILHVFLKKNAGDAQKRIGFGH